MENGKKPKVAVIAVHGVGDPGPGATAQSISALLARLHQQTQPDQGAYPAFTKSELYSQRFPTWYDWARAQPPYDQTSHPDPHFLGAKSWSNAYGSGDYIGRALFAHITYWGEPGDSVARELDRLIASPTCRSTPATVFPA